MPGSTLPNIGIILPSLGGDEGIWDDEINAGLTLIDAHNHTSGKGLAITSAAISIDADLSFGGFTISALGKISFSAITAPVSGSKNLFVSSADNELYWRSNAGTNVKLTNGASINTSLVGGIVGDYASVGAALEYDDANDRYTFKQQSTFPWAKVACGGVQIFEFNTTESVSVNLVCPAALAGSYSIELPTALPGSTLLWQITSAGVVTFSNTIVNSIVMTANTDITVSGTGEFRHGDREITQSGLALPIVGTYAASVVSSAVVHTLQTTTGVVYIEIRGLKIGDRLKSIKLFATAANEPTLEIWNQEAGASSSKAYTSSGGPITSNNSITLTLNAAINITAALGEMVFLAITAGTSTVVVRAITIVFDRP